MTGQTPSYPLSALARDQCGNDITALATKISQFFASVSADLQPLAPGCSYAYYVEDLSDYTIYPYEVERKLNRLNAYKSCGPDNIPNWLHRDYSVWLAEPICTIHNQSIIDGIVPSTWKFDYVIPAPNLTHP